MSKNTNNGGIVFFGLLTLVFITLKLIGYIGWSWWYVLAPIWIPIAILLIIFMIWLIVMLIKEANKKS
ncbi:hypothetical protein CYV15_08700 [Riemerella anatipestifer]|nr:hypothetical protein CYV15_08700 [Riemerella anatipestifer]